MLCRILLSPPYAPAPDQLSINRRIEDGTATLLVSGEIDVASAGAFEEELHETEDSYPRRIVVDIDGLGFIDSTGLHALLRAHRRAEQNGHELVLTRVPDHVRRLFHISGIAARLAVA
jgi:anti-anti-sigma factor